MLFTPITNIRETTAGSARPRAGPRLVLYLLSAGGLGYGFRSFIADGDGHTFILRDFERAVGGTTVREWIGAMLVGGESYVSVSD